MGRKFHLQTGVTGPANAWSPLHYVPLRLACGNPSIPGADYIPRKPRTSFFRFLLFSSVRTDAGFCRVLSQVLPVPVPGADSYTAQTALLFFRFLLFSSVTTDICFCRVLSQVLPVPVPGRRFIHRANRAPVVFAFFCFRRLEPTLAFAGCLSVFTCSSTRRSPFKKK